MPPTLAQKWLPQVISDPILAPETLNAPRKYPVITRDGSEGEYTLPANGKRSEMEAYLRGEGAKLHQSWPDWTAEHIVPQTPTGWGVLLATGGAGVAGRALATSGSLMAPIVRSGLFRIAAGTAGGIAGYVNSLRARTDVPPEGTVDPSAPTSPIQGQTRSLVDATTDAFFQSLVGESGTFALNLASRNIINPLIRKSSDAKGYLGYLADNTSGLATLPPNKAAQQLAALAYNEGLASRASTQIENTIQTITGQSGMKNVHSPALSRFYNEAKLQGHVADPQDIYPLRTALDGYTRIMSETMDPGNLARAESIRQAVHGDLVPALASGPKGLALWQNALNEYGFAKNVSDIMKKNYNEIFPKSGGMDTDRLISLVHEHFGAKPANNDFIRGKVRDLLTNLQRGADLGDPMDIKGSWGRIYGHTSGGVGFSAPRTNQWAGDPWTLGPGAKAAVNPLIGQQVEGTGVIPSGMRFQSPVTSQQPDQGSVPSSQ